MRNSAPWVAQRMLPLSALDEAAVAVEAAPVERRAEMRAGVQVAEGVVIPANHEDCDLVSPCAEGEAAALAIGNLREAAERHAGQGVVIGKMAHRGGLLAALLAGGLAQLADQCPGLLGDRLHRQP